MGPNKPRKFLYSQDNHQQNEKTTYRMGENIHKWCDQLGLNFQNIQTARTTPQQQQYKQPIWKMGKRPRETFSKKTHRWPIGTRKDAHHC